MSVKTLYTNTVPQDIAGVVRAIPAPDNCTKFQSAPTTYDEGKDTWTQWASAWQNPQSGLWTLETHQRFVNADSGNTKAGDNNSTRQKKTIAKNVSFFDALHFCAYEEMSRKGAGAAVVDMNGAKKAAHFSSVAAQGHQPLDAQGIPHPAAYGEILTDGLFDDSAYEMAEHTSGVQLNVKKAEESRQIVDFGPLDGGDVSNAQIVDLARDKQIRKEQLIEKFRSTTAASKTYGSVLQHNATRPGFWGALAKDLTPEISNFGNDFACCIYAVGGFMTGSIILINKMTYGNPLGSSTTIVMWGLGATFAAAATPALWNEGAAQFSRLRAALSFNHKLRKLPESSLKEDIKAHRQLVRACYHFAKAATIVEKHGAKSKWHMRRAFNQVSKGARIAGMPEIETNQLRMALVEGRFPTLDTIASQIENSETGINDMFEQLTADIREADDVPALEHKQEVPIDMGATIKDKVPQPR